MTTRTIAKEAPSRARGPQATPDVVVLEPSPGFVITKEVESIVRRALSYLRAGYPVHFAGPPGVGKTSLAFHTAALLGSPAIFLQGDDELVSSDLLGRDTEQRRSRVVDNFVRSVTKVEEETSRVWVDNRLTVACQHGYTLIYDEFNRSPPETNNALLSVLSEGVLSLPKQRQGGRGYLEVHPNFRAIFTSNPEEYAGVHKAQDALLDRIVTMQLDHHDRQTEIAIVAARATLAPRAAAVVVDIVRALRGQTESGARPTIRAAIAIGRVVHTSGARVHPDDEVFRWACRDILSRDLPRSQRPGGPTNTSCIDEAVTQACAAHAH